MWFFRLKACVAVFYIVCTCTVNSCRASLQYDGQASLNYQSNKCNQCNYAWSDPSAFRPHLITHNGEKSKNVNNVTLHLIACSVWGIIWKHTVEKNQTNATSVTLHPLMQAIWGSIWKHTVEKNQTNATSVTLHPLMQVIWGRIWKHTVEKNPTNKCNQCDYASYHLFNLRIDNARWRKIKLNATSVTLHPLTQAIWGHI